MSKVYSSAAEAIADLKSGMTLMSGGFGLCGNPENLIRAVADLGVTDLTVISNNCGTDEFGLGILLQARQIKKMISSYVGENKNFEQQFLSGELEVELTPQGTLAERLRAGGAGIPAFFTPAGVGTQVADGGLPWRYDGAGGIAVASPAKETREFDGREYVMERGITVRQTICSPKNSRTSRTTVLARVARASYIVSTMPPNSSCVFGRLITSRMTSIIWASPSMAKYSHWMGITTSVDAAKAACVSSPNEGGQSIST